jgi:hypothetical protein
VPNRVIDSLVAAKTLKIFAEGGYVFYEVLCNTTNLRLDIQVDERTILTLDEDVLMDKKNGDFPGYCITALQPYRYFGPSSSYANQPSWVFGASFFTEFCLSYNYANDSLGLGYTIND